MNFFIVRKLFDGGLIKLDCEQVHVTLGFVHQKRWRNDILADPEPFVEVFHFFPFLLNKRMTWY